MQPVFPTTNEPAQGLAFTSHGRPQAVPDMQNRNQPFPNHRLPGSLIEDLAGAALSQAGQVLRPTPRQVLRTGAGGGEQFQESLRQRGPARGWAPGAPGCPTEPPPEPAPGITPPHVTGPFIPTLPLQRRAGTLFTPPLRPSCVQAHTQALLTLGYMRCLVVTPRNGTGTA